MDSQDRSGGRSPGQDDDTLQYPKVVLVTGACRFLGGYLTARLAQNPLINHVIAVDAIAPSKDLLRRMGRAEFVRADIRNPFIAKVIRNGDVDTVVHAAAASYAPRSGGKAALKELNVMGAIQLFAACQKAPSVRRVILKSTSEVYGSSAFDPVLFTEDSSSRRPPGEGFARDSSDIEGYARGLARRRPDITLTILRLANMIGPAMDTALSRYLSVASGAHDHRPRPQAAIAPRAGCARGTGARDRGGQSRHVQRRRARDHHDVSGHPARGPGPAAGAALRVVRCRFAVARNSLH